MCHFLIADDEPNIRRDFRLLLESKSHTCVEASDIVEIRDAVEISESENGEPFDLILLDYDFGDGTNGLQAMEKLSFIYCEHRVVVLTAARDFKLPSEFARLGAIGHLLKPVPEDQFWVTIDSALTRREQFIDKKEDWEAALELLHRNGYLRVLITIIMLTNNLLVSWQPLNLLTSNFNQNLSKPGNVKKK